MALHYKNKTKKSWFPYSLTLFYFKALQRSIALQTQGTFLGLVSFFFFFFFQLSLLLLSCFVLLCFMLWVARTWIRPRTTYWNTRLALVSSSAISWNPHLNHAQMSGKSGVSHLCPYRHKGYVTADACPHAFPYNPVYNTVNAVCPLD